MEKRKKGRKKRRQKEWREETVHQFVVFPVQISLKIQHDGW